MKSLVTVLIHFRSPRTANSMDTRRVPQKFWVMLGISKCRGLPLQTSGPTYPYGSEVLEEALPKLLQFWCHYALSGETEMDFLYPRLLYSLKA